MSQKKTAQADTVTNMKAVNYEVGAGYALSNSSQLTFGYRIQDMKSTNTTQSNRTETTTMKGFLVGANINF
jgi:predicted porin